LKNNKQLIRRLEITWKPAGNQKVKPNDKKELKFWLYKADGIINFVNFHKKLLKILYDY
jgi:hypothetical protein